MRPRTCAAQAAEIKAGERSRALVAAKSLERLAFENLLGAPELTTPSSRFYKKPAEYATSLYAYYEVGARVVGAPRRCFLILS